MTLPRLTRRERQIMDILFQRGEATVSEVMEALPDPPSYSAVRATMRILEEKGHLRHREDGPRYVYLPKLGAEQARRAALTHLLETFFGGSAEQAVMALAELRDAELTPEQLEELAERIRTAGEEGR
ncbi:MAG TPA: BlaI/MecI/CopY family transcriptional regulator [Gemmatimonadales bacterium]|nr:BlaI/MecI/CopY family transcriptional regulator [Gemmatimonadales bacterium]